MGLFKKKSDPISDRARELNKKIAALESEIQRLAAQKPAAEPVHVHPVAAPAPAEIKAVPHPRLRSTAIPHGPTVSGRGVAALAQEPEFEDVNQERITDAEEEGARALVQTRPDLGVAKSDFTSIWKRFRANFRGPVTSNPKLVNYLAAGSIQGLRPLRYEKRVQRNRFIVLTGILILVIWGVIVFFMPR